MRKSHLKPLKHSPKKRNKTMELMMIAKYPYSWIANVHHNVQASDF